MKIAGLGFPFSCFLALFFLSAGLLYAGEIPVGAPELGNAPALKLDPVAASDGTDFLVVWRDGRGGHESLLASP